MSLLAWYPFNGDYKNKGCGDAELSASTTPTFVNGKMGKSLNSGALRWTAEQTPNILNNDAISIAFWVYIDLDEGSTSNRAMFFGNDTMSTLGGRQYSLFNYPTSNDLHWSWQNCIDGTYSMVTSGVLTGVIPARTWTHIAVTYKNPSGKIYINGTLKTTFSGTYKTDSFAFLTDVIHDSAYHKFNDFRVYDECITAKEVHELSKGLVAHYTMDRGIGNPNLIRMGGLSQNSASSISYDITTDTYTIVSPVGTSTTWGMGPCIGSTNKVIIPYGEYYRISCEVYVPTEHYLVTDYNNYAYNGTSWSGNDNDLGSARIKNAAKETIPAKTWTKIVRGSQNAHASNTDQLSIYECSTFGLYTTDDTESTTWYIRHVKVELGTEVTDWCPNENDTLYNNMGYGLNILEDCSGNGYNGTLVGTTTTSSSRRYKNCLSFDGTDDYVACGRPFPTDALTVNVWAYMDDWSNYTTRILSCTEGGGWNFEPSGDYFNFPVGTGSSSNTYITCTGTTKRSACAGWHMFTGTYDGLSSKIYLDGVLENTVTQYTTTTPIFYNSVNGLFIGAEAAGTQTSPTGNYFNGKISDVKIYSTALSADDIKELYNTATYADKNGNLRTYEFVEGDSTEFFKTGITEVNSNTEGNYYTGTQYNRSNMSLTYDYETNVFKDYGITKALKITATSTSTSNFMAYSYLMDPTVTTYDPDSVYTVSMYVYNPSDCNANFRLNLEHSNTWVSNYQKTTSNINDDTHDEVIWVWGTFKVNSSDNKMYIMFYPNPNQTSVFTSGYQLIGGITVTKGDKPVRPDCNAFHEVKEQQTILGKQYIQSNEFIEI